MMSEMPENGENTRTLRSHRRRYIPSELEACGETRKYYRYLAFVGRSPLHRGPNTCKCLLWDRGSWVWVMQLNYLAMFN